MAKELLNDHSRCTTADIFSLGITLYEIACINVQKNSGGKENVAFILPSNGPQWHELRSGNQLNVPTRPLSFNLLLFAMMNPFPLNRPRAAEILTLPEVERFALEPELLQLGLDAFTDSEIVNNTPMNTSSPVNVHLHRPKPKMNYFHNNRPASFDPAMDL